MFYLQAKSPAVYEMLFNPPKSEKDVIEVSDIDSDTFRLFLNCVMGFTQYDFENAVSIFPVVWKLQIEKSIQDCINVLDPREMMDENVSYCLNMATSFKCEALVKKIVDYIYYTYNPYRFLENDAYCLWLEPDSLVEIIKKMEYLDTLTMDIVLNWGNNYVKKNQKFDSVKLLFEAFHIDLYLKRSVEIFGVPQTVPWARGFLKDIFDYNSMIEMLSVTKSYEFNYSNWKRITKQDSLTEEMVIKSPNCKASVRLSYRISTNYVVYYELPNNTKMEGDVFTTVVSVDGEAIKKSAAVYIKDNKKINRYIEKYYTTSFSIQGNHVNDAFTLKIKYRFLRDCRILLTNRPGDEDKKKLYFTKDVNLVRLS